MTDRDNPFIYHAVVASKLEEKHDDQPEGELKKDGDGEKKSHANKSVRINQQSCS